MEKIRKVYHKGKEVVVVDYSESKVEQMIQTFDSAKRLVQVENKQVLVLSVFGKNYITPVFMRHVETEIKDIEQYIDKNAITGLSTIQKWIFLGMKMWYKRPLYKFDSYDEALEYLVED